MTCKHEIWEKDTAAADGYCPICLAAMNSDLRIALGFCLDIATEAYQDNYKTVGSEVALRHIMRKCSEVLQKGERP